MHARLVNPLLDYATVINTTSGENLQIPSQSGFSTATIVGQGSTVAVSEPTFNAFVTLGAYKFSALAQLSRELILDSGVDIIGFLAGQFGNAFGNAIGDKVVNGTGTVEPTGFLTAANTGVRVLHYLCDRYLALVNPNRFDGIYRSFLLG